MLCGDSRAYPGYRDLAVAGTTLSLKGVFPDHEDDVAELFVVQHLEEIRSQLTGSDLADTLIL